MLETVKPGLLFWIISLTDNLFVCLFPAGSGLTSSLIALIANAGPEDQAIATAGEMVSAIFKRFY